MKICFVGLGSIGTRHLRNLSALLTERKVDFSIDALRSSARPLPEEVNRLINKQYTKIDSLPDDYDIAFICSPTSAHFDDIGRMAGRARHLFIEKPVFDKPHDISALPLREDGVYYVACPLRYNSVLQYIKNFTKNTRIYSARVICSTYLPDWRPSVDYRTVYSAHRDMGGGVSIDLIHEWDYISWLFGMPERVLYAGGQYSDLELDSDDLALYIGQYSDRLVSLHLDYFGRNERREIELYTSEDTVTGDIRNGKVRFLKSGETVDLSEPRDKYQLRELEHFLDIVNEKIPNDSDILHAQNVLSIAKGDWNK